MIAILHKNNVIGLLLADVISIDGDSINTASGGAKGILHDILIIDGYTYVEDVIPALYEEIALPTMEGQEPQTEQRLVSPEQHRPYIEKDGVKLYVGDTINPDDFTDTRYQLQKTPEQLAAARITSIEEENINLMLALTQVYEEKEAEKAAAEEESINNMLAITELYEMVLTMQGGVE